MAKILREDDEDLETLRQQSIDMLLQYRVDKDNFLMAYFRSDDEDPAIADAQLLGKLNTHQMLILAKQLIFTSSEMRDEHPYITLCRHIMPYFIMKDHAELDEEEDEEDWEDEPEWMAPSETAPDDDDVLN